MHRIRVSPRSTGVRKGACVTVSSSAVTLQPSTVAPYFVVIFDVSKVISAREKPWIQPDMPAAAPVLYGLAAAQPSAPTGAPSASDRRRVTVFVSVPMLWP